MLSAEKASLTYNSSIAIPENSDLDTYVEVGLYSSNSKSISETISNSPFNTSGFLMYVIKVTSLNRYIQIVYPNTVIGEFAIRNKNNDNYWGSWAYYRKSGFMNLTEYMLGKSNTYVVGSYSFDEGGIPVLNTSSSRIRLKNIIEVRKGQVFKVTLGPKYYSFQYYLYYVENNQAVVMSRTTEYTDIDKYISVPHDGYLIVVFKKLNSTSVSVSEFDATISISDCMSSRDIIDGNIPSINRDISTEIANNSDLNDFKTSGTYASKTADNTNTLINSPYADCGFILYVIKYCKFEYTSLERYIQISIANDRIKPIKYRNYTANGWESWRTTVDSELFDVGDYTEIERNTDLNDLKNIGVYMSTSDEITQTLSNCPYNSWGFRMFVLKTNIVNTNGDRIVQIAIRNTIYDDSMIAFRNYVGEDWGWSDWRYNITDKALSEYCIYPQNYVLDEANRVSQNVRSIQNGHTITLSGISDLHYRYNDDSTKKAIREMSMGLRQIHNSIHIDWDVCYGDIGYVFKGATDYEDGVTAYRDVTELITKAFNQNQIRLVGNHDTNSLESPKYFTMNEIYSYFGIYNGETIRDNEHRNRSYCYFDDEYRKIRFICLNTSDFSSRPNEEPNIGSYGNYNYYMGVDKINWMCDKMDLTSKSDASSWQIIIMSHIPFDQWQMLSDSYPDIIYAYENGTSFTVNGVTRNFSGINTAKLSLFIHGHEHAYTIDNIYRNNNGSLQRIKTPRICVPNALNGRDCGPYGTDNSDIIWGIGEEYLKVPNTKDSTAFVINTIDPISKVIYSHCYGAGLDRILHYEQISISNTYTISNSILTPVEWTSMDTNVVTINNGIITKVSSGNIMVYLKDSNGNREYWNLSVN